MKKYLVFSLLLAATGYAAYAQSAPEAQKAVQAIKVEKIVTAAAVEKREPVGESSAFDGGVLQVYTWTKIASEQVPVTIKHVYYLNGKLAREISLPVNASPYRVWSVKNVTPGNWKVEVTDEAGSVLAASVFTVGAPASAE